ncbi:MAG: preprotein translocase subunit SecG [Bacteroidetes bacterium]|nr:preprotein translocase subunit SecG [Bacteroidota bacterium]
MYILLTVLIIIVSILIMAVVLVQNPKGGGLGAGFGGAASNIMGVQKTGDILEKATWYLVIALLVFSLSSAIFINRNQGGEALPEIGNVTDQGTAPIQQTPNTLPTLPGE